MERRDFGQQSERLRKMLSEGGLRSQRLEAGARGIVFSGREREWFVAAQLTDEWLNVATTFCELPDGRGVRARLLEHTMRLNRTMTLLKFTILERSCVLELDYRAEDVDATVLAKLIDHVVSGAQEQYPAVFRIVSGDETLDALQVSLYVPGPML